MVATVGVRRFQTFIELRRHLAASNAESNEATVEACNGQSTTHGRGSARSGGFNRLAPGLRLSS
jgi:hypothetical protein